MAAYLCLISLIFVTINLVVDLLYFAVDPRLRVHDARGIEMSDRSTRWQRFLSSDLWYSYRRSPVAVLSPVWRC
jgi:hypothetical protein